MPGRQFQRIVAQPLTILAHQHNTPIACDGEHDHEIRQLDVDKILDDRAVSDLHILTENRGKWQRSSPHPPIKRLPFARASHDGWASPYRQTDWEECSSDGCRPHWR